MAIKKHEKDAEDIEFILNEIVKFQSMENREMIQYLGKNKRDARGFIPAPNGSGIWICGAAAIERFIELAERYLQTLKEDRFNFDKDKFVDSVIKQFTWFYITNFDKRNGQITQKDSDKMLSAAVKNARQKHKAITHYIPCVVTQSNNPAPFDIGLVKFVPMSQFLAENQEDFETQKIKIRDEHIERVQKEIEAGTPDDRLATPEMSARLGDDLVSKTQHFFENFRWIAIVEIPKCDTLVSRQRAENVIEGALNILKLFFGSLHGERLRQGHSLAKPPETASLTKNEQGEFKFSIGWASTDAFATDSWTNILQEADGFYLNIAVSTLELYISPSETSHLKQRLLDALAWYGQAVSEQQVSVKIVKYVAALERLTITKKMDEGLTRAVTRRVTLLICDDMSKLYETLSEVVNLYDYRSSLMHGSISPFDEKLLQIVPIAEKITRTATFRCFELFSLIDKSKPNAKPQDLELKYEEIENKIFDQ